MGVMRFLVPRRDHLAPDAIERAYLAGIDEIPWQARAQWTDQGLTVERAESDSGNFFIPCRINGHGELVLSTASLMERQRPYHLGVELARGTLNRLRNQLAAWEAAGLTVPQNLQAPLTQAHEQLSWAVTRQEELETADGRAEQATLFALQAINLLNDAFVTQALAARHQQAGKLHTLWGVNLGSSTPSADVTRQIAPVFNSAQVPLAWRDIEAREGKLDWTKPDQQIEWCRANGLKVCGGPLVAIDKWSLPDWMYLFGEGDEDNFRSCMVEYIRAVVSRYKGKVQLWMCAARLNRNNDFGQDEEERLRLAAMAIETIRRIDPRSPIVILLDQPWGAFMSREECDLSPLHFADALVRSDLGLAGIGLEINFGYPLVGTEPRDVIEFGRQLERFSTLGLPLLVSLAAPSAGIPDPQARIDAHPVNFGTAGEPSPSSQRAWAEKYLSALLARPAVQGILWNQLLDSQPHAFAHGGLFDQRDQAKPIVETLLALRKQHLA